MPHQLRALVVLEEDPGLIPRTHISARSPPGLQFQGIQCSLLTSRSTRCTHGVQTDDEIIHKLIN